MTGTGAIREIQRLMDARREEKDEGGRRKDEMEIAALLGIDAAGLQPREGEL